MLTRLAIFLLDSLFLAPIKVHEQACLELVIQLHFMRQAPLTTPFHQRIFQITPTLVCAMAQLQRKDSDDDLLAGWSSELEELLYSPEVEEAIKEVSPCYY